MEIKDLKPGIFFEFRGEPWKVLKTTHIHMGRGGAVIQTKMENLLDGRVQERALRPRDEIKEADIEQGELIYLYSNRGKYWFCDSKDKSKRFALREDIVGESRKFLKTNSVVKIVSFKGRIVGVEVPIKMIFKVIEAPPAVRGDTQGMPLKEVRLENDTCIMVPIFIKEGDSIVVNTQMGEYVERA